MSEISAAELLRDALGHLLADHSDADARSAAEAAGWAPDLWAALVQAGMPRADADASGLGEVGVVAYEAGRYAAAVPLADAVLLANWLAGLVGLAADPEDVLTVPVPHPADRLLLTDGRLSGVLHRVPWGSRADWILAVAASDAGSHVVAWRVRTAQVQVHPARNMAGEPRDLVSVDGAAVAHTAAADATVRRELELRGALSRALLSAGAMAAVSEITVRYSEQRQQFGRAIAQFQAVGSRLVRLVSEAKAAELATAVALRRFAADGTQATFEVAAAKVAAARAAREVVQHAHQVHGAMGMTREYELHHFTRRLQVWRHDWGTEDHWAERLGADMYAAGSAGAWPRIATGLVST